MNNRVFFKSSEGFKDVSSKVASYVSGNFEMSYEEGDFIYVGARLPFNHLYFKVNPEDPPEVEPEQPELRPSVLVEYWDGLNWVQMVETVDLTDSLLNSGHIEFTPNRDKQWMRGSTNFGGNSITGLETLNVYDKYWLRVSFDGPLEASTNYIGNIFSTDADLKVEFPDLLKSNVLAAFETGKQDWEDQHLRAADIVIQDLVDKTVIQEKGQILNWRDYTTAAIQKVAEIAFGAFGDSYVDNSVAARVEYNARMAKRIHRVDLDRNAIETPKESFNTHSWFSR